MTEAGALQQVMHLSSAALEQVRSNCTVSQEERALKQLSARLLKVDLSK
jgi:hypothetical protein